MPTYDASSGTPPNFDPVDTDEVLDFVWNWAAKMAADSDTIVESYWEVTTGTLGDGSTARVTEAGSVTPDAPTIIESNTKTKAWMWFTTAGTHTIENTIRTTNGRVWSRSAKVVVGSL